MSSSVNVPESVQSWVDNLEVSEPSNQGLRFVKQGIAKAFAEKKADSQTAQLIRERKVHRVIDGKNHDMIFGFSANGNPWLAFALDSNETTVEEEQSINNLP